MSDFAQKALERASRALELALAAGAESAEVLGSSGSSALTRFAGNRIHQNVAEADTSVSIRAVVGSQVGVASTNRADDASISACAQAALGAARSAPHDPQFPGLPAPRPIDTVDRGVAATRDFDANARALAVRSIIEQSSSRGLTAAGGIKVTDEGIAVVNSLGVASSGSVTGIRATVLSMTPNGGSGWASFVSSDASELAATALGDEAATLAERSEGAGDLPEGEYTVVLAPEAVADIVDFLGYLAFGAKPVHEGRSFLSGHIGEKLLDEKISITDDALAAHSLGLTFDFEGQPRQRVSLIDAGVARAFVTDSAWAARLGMQNTGHALPAPNPYGPLPLNLEMAGGDASIDELISSVSRGVYVTRFHYVNVEDPMPVTLTGMTRDGTFMIENGHLTSPLKNLRFTQNMTEALSHVGGITRERRFIGTESSPTLVPGLLLEKFRFTGQTS